MLKANIIDSRRHRRTTRALSFAFLLVCLRLCAQTAAPAPTPAPMDKPSISLSPAVIMARGDFGQSLTHARERSSIA